MATLFGNSGSGFNFPDRMLDDDREEVMVDHRVGSGVTQFNALPELLALGEDATLVLLVTVLSSRNSLADLLSEVRLLNVSTARATRQTSP